MTPGSALYDFGDMVRTAAPTTREDDLAIGRINSSATFLNEAEVANLAFSGKLLTLECGIRFLTDHQQGDTYFKIARPGHNLDRCRNHELTHFAGKALIQECVDPSRTPSPPNFRSHDLSFRAGLISPFRPDET